MDVILVHLPAPMLYTVQVFEVGTLILPLFLPQLLPRAGLFCVLSCNWRFIRLWRPGNGMLEEVMHIAVRVLCEQALSCLGGLLSQSCSVKQVQSDLSSGSKLIS